ncbi:MAG: helix-hairpin-helix domain-containing protein [bacterium]|nr:helix-hairpin-helix domain-containing protein [bacterium]
MSKTTQKIKNMLFTRAEYVVIGMCFVLVAGLIYFNISYSVDDGDAGIEYVSPNSILGVSQNSVFSSENKAETDYVKSNSLAISSVQNDVVSSKSEDRETRTKAQEIININTADKQQLMTIKGIGEVKAEAIISYRESVGKFKSVEELLQVRGIGKATLEKIRDCIVAE